MSINVSNKYLGSFLCVLPIHFEIFLNRIFYVFNVCKRLFSEDFNQLTFLLFFVAALVFGICIVMAGVSICIYEKSSISTDNLD